MSNGILTCQFRGLGFRPGEVGFPARGDCAGTDLVYHADQLSYGDFQTLLVGFPERNQGKRAQPTEQVPLGGPYRIGTTSRSSIAA